MPVSKLHGQVAAQPELLTGRESAMSLIREGACRLPDGCSRGMSDTGAGIGYGRSTGEPAVRPHSAHDPS